MRFQKRRQLALVCAILATCAACAKGEAVSAEQVLDNMLAAIGPERSRHAVQSLSTTAEGAGPDGPFAVTVTSIPPDTVYFRQQSERGITEIWSTPERTWGGDAGEEYEPLGMQVRDFVRSHEFHLMLLEMKSRFSGFELQGEDEVSGKECLRVSMLDEIGETASICVRSDDWLPAELRVNPASVAGPIRIVFDDWRVVDGLNQFHSLQLTEDSDRLFTYEYVDISVNTFAYEIRVPPPTVPRVQGDGSSGAQ
jgi:hypothetical protein